jgi:hypothetical protein
MLQREQEHAAERERDYREHIRYLSQMLHESQQRYDRLLEAPRVQPAAEASRPAPRTTTPSMTTLPATWQRILGYMREQSTPMSPQEVEQTLDLQSSPRHAMKRMCDAGLLRRVGQGQYVIGEEE